MTASSVSYSASRTIRAPYEGISIEDYTKEKRRLQLELLKIQIKVIKKKQRVCILFDGRDAAGKGSTINRFAERLMPMHVRTVQLGIPTRKESKNWFQRYENLLPQKNELVLFDRSWYNRALIEPTMGYCSKSQYKDFMQQVLDWEHKLIKKGLVLIKFYLSVDNDTQLIRFHQRLSDPLTFWKISPNDFQARKKWETFTKYKEQMFRHTSSPKSPWVVIKANRKMEARLTCMLHVVRSLSNHHFEPLTGETIPKSFDLTLNDIVFKGLSIQQYRLLKNLAKDSKTPVDIKVPEG